jgi:hypothetical protein
VGLGGPFITVLGIPVLILDLPPCMDRRSWVYGGAFVLADLKRQLVSGVYD